MDRTAARDEPLKQILERIRSKYSTEITPITLNGQTLRFLQIKDLDEIIFERLITTDLDDFELPFWGKIWEAGIVLAAFLTAQSVISGRKILEIGCGMGVGGLFACAGGHDVTLSDYREEILNFTRANALLNDLGSIPIRELDWTKSPPQLRYDWIVGSEVVYHRPTYDALVQFLLRTLKPQGTIFLAKSTSLPTPEFFALLTQHFRFKSLEKVLRGKSREYAITLYAIKRKEEI